MEMRDPWAKLKPSLYSSPRNLEDEQIQVRVKFPALLCLSLISPADSCIPMGLSTREENRGVVTAFLHGTSWPAPLLGCGKHTQEPEDKFFLFAFMLHTPRHSNCKDWTMSSAQATAG